jgi:hypothetical protein
VSNELIFGAIIIVIIIVIARKWDSFKWILGAALAVLIIWTAAELGMFNKMIDDAKDKLPAVSVE